MNELSKEHIDFLRQQELKLWFGEAYKDLYDEFGNKKLETIKEIDTSCSITIGKTRSKNTHLTPKKKKRKK